MQNSSKPLYKGVQVIWYTLYLIEVLLVVRFALKLTGANPAATFTDFIYSLSGVFIVPFMSVFSTQAVGQSVFEWITLLAMLVYWFVATALVKLLVMNKPVSTLEAEGKLSQEEKL
jgi:hypothetical protein